MPIQKKKCAKILVLDMKLNKLYHFPPALAIQNEKIRANARSRHKSSLSALLPAPEHFSHVHRRLLQHLITNMRVDVRSGLVVRVANDLHDYLCISPFFRAHSVTLFRASCPSPSPRSERKRKRVLYVGMLLYTCKNYLLLHIHLVLAVKIGICKYHHTMAFRVSGFRRPPYK